MRSVERETHCAARGCAVLAAIVLVALFAAAPASAAGDPGHLRIGAKLNIRSSNGYLLTIGGSGKNVRLAVTSKRAAAVYIATAGRVTGGSIRAWFGHLGVVDVTFYPRRLRSDRPRQLKSFCSYSPPRREYSDGLFVGTIRFRGEGGYTKVSSTHAFGRVAPLPRSLCGLVGPAHAFDDVESSPGWPTAIGALAFTRGGLAVFRAGRAFDRSARGFNHLGRFRVPKLGRAEVGYEAFAIGSVGKLAVIRLAVARGGRGSYDFSESPRNLEVSPPPPFSGVGRYRSCADQRWSGSLAVALPGAGQVGLSNSPGGDTFAIADAVPEFHESECGVIPLSQSRLRP
jgi:hypothetical protein